MRWGGVGIPYPSAITTKAGGKHPTGMFSCQVNKNIHTFHHKISVSNQNRV